MPLSARDVLFVLRAQDFASREVRNLAGNFGILGKQMSAVAAGGAAQLAQVQDRQVKGMRHVNSELHALTGAKKVYNSEMRATNALLADEIKYGQYTKSQRKDMARAISANRVAMANNNQEMVVANKLAKERSTVIRQSAQDESKAVKDRVASQKREIEARQGQIRQLMASGAAYTAIGAVAAGVGVAMTAGMVSLAKSTADFRQQIALAQTQAQDIGVSIKQIEGIAFDVGESIPVPMEELASGLYDIFSSFDFAKDPITGAGRLLRQFAQDAVAGQVSLEDASRANISVLNAWQLGAESASDVSDIMFRLVERGIGTYGEFTGAIGRAIPATRRLDENFETLGASMAFLTRQGLSTEQAATASARAMELVADPRVVQRMEELGFSVRDAAGNFLPLNDIVAQMADRWGELPGPQRADEMMKIFAGAGYRIQARRFFDTVIPNYKAFGKEIDRMADREGAARRAYITMFEQPQSQIQLLANNAKILAFEFGEHLFGALNRVLSVGMAVVKWFRELDPTTKATITTIMQFSSVLLVVVGTMSVFVGVAKLLAAAFLSLKAIPGITAAVNGIGAAFGGAAFATAGWSAAILPLGAALAVIAGAVVYFVSVAQKSKDATIDASSAAATLAESADAAFTDVQNLSAGLDDAADSAMAFARENQNTIKQLQEMGDAAARDYLIEIGVTLSQRSDMEMEEIQAHLHKLAETAGIRLDIPIALDDINLEDSVATQTERIISNFESMFASQRWNSVLNVGINSTKQQVTALAETIASAFEIGDVSGAIAAWQHYEDSVRGAGAGAAVTKEALNFLADEIARIQQLGDHGTDSADSMSTVLHGLAEAGQISGKQLADMNRELGITKSWADYAASGVNVFSTEVQGMPGTMADGVDAAGELSGALEDNAGAAEEAKSAIQDYLDELTAMSDPVFAMAKAAKDEVSAMEDRRKAMEDITAAKKAMDEAGTEEERAEAVSKLAKAEADLAEAQIDRFQAEKSQIAAVAMAVDENNRWTYTLQELKSMLATMELPPDVTARIISDFHAMRNAAEGMAEQAGTPIEPKYDGDEVTLGVAETLIELNKIPDWKDVLLGIKGHDYVIRQLDDVRRRAEMLDGKVVSVHVQTSQGGGTIPAGTGAHSPYRGTGRQQHEGGWAGSGPLRDLFNLRANEIPSILERGEFVLSKEMVKQLQIVPRFHAGGGIGPFTGAGATAEGIFSSVKQKGIIAGWEPGEYRAAIQSAITKVEELRDSWEEAAEAAQAATERAKLVKDIGAAKDAEARAEATERLREWDRERAVTAEKARIERALEEAELQLQLRLNEEKFYFDQMSTKAQLANVNKRLKAERAFTDEWMDLMSQRQQLEEELAEARQRVIDNKAEWKFEKLTTKQQLGEIQNRIQNEKRYTDEWMELARQREDMMKQLAERQNNITANQKQWRFEHMSTKQQLSNIQKRIKRERRYSDEWMTLARQREDLMKELNERQDNIAANQRQWKLERKSTEIQLKEIQKRIRAERRYTDEWMDLARQREQLMEELRNSRRERRQEAKSRYEDELAELNDLLETHSDVTKQMADAERDYAKAVQDAQTNATNAIKDAQNARRDALSEALSLTSGDLMPTDSIADLAGAQNEQIQEWHRGILELKRRGLSQDVIEALGIADSPQQLEAVRQLLGSSVEEIDKLNTQIRNRQELLNDIIKEESTNTAFELARSIKDIQAELQNTLTDLKSDHVAAMKDLKAELDAIGKQQGLGYAEAIAAGIATGLPAIKKQVQAVQTALRALKTTESLTTMSGAQERVAGYREAYGLKPDPKWDAIWAQRILSGDTTYRYIRSRLQARVEAGGTFDSGGIWPSGTMGVNLSGKPEYVFTEQQMEKMGANRRAVVINIEDGAFQFNGPIDSATLPDVERLLNEFKDELADELRSNE